MHRISHPYARDRQPLFKKIAQPTACTLQCSTQAFLLDGLVNLAYSRVQIYVYLQTTQVSVSECHLSLSLSTVFSPVGRQKGGRSYVHKYKKATRGKTLPCQL